MIGVEIEVVVVEEEEGEEEEGEVRERWVVVAVVMGRKWTQRNYIIALTMSEVHRGDYIVF